MSESRDFDDDDERARDEALIRARKVEDDQRKVEDDQRRFEEREKDRIKEFNVLKTKEDREKVEIEKSKRKQSPFRSSSKVDVSTEDFLKKLVQLEHLSEEIFKDLNMRSPKDLIKERKLRNWGGENSKEFKHFVYGYSVTIGPDGKPEVRRFGNVKPSTSKNPIEFAEKREPLVDIIDSDMHVRVIAEISGVDKNNIHLEATDKRLIISSKTPKKYYREVNFSVKVHPDSARATFRNGILEVTLDKKKPSTSRRKPLDAK